MIEDRDSLEALRQILTEWNDELPGVTRVELRPYNKHTGELMIPEDDCPRLFLESAAPEVAEAAEALAFLTYLMTFLRGVIEP